MIEGQIALPGKVAGRRVVAVRRLSGGRSNPTFRLTTEDRATWILRTRPPGGSDPSAHRIDREVRVLRALAEYEIPVPRVVEWQPDPVVGEPYYIMSDIDGVVPHDPALPDFGPLLRSAAFLDAARTLAAIHRQDPVAIGLGDFGRMGDYNQRQVRRWARFAVEYDAPSQLRALAARLDQSPPQQRRQAVVHGDFRIGNLIFDPATGTVAGVVDWELATIGDPMADLAYFTLCYALDPSGLILPGLDKPLPQGVPDLAAVIAAYCAETATELPTDWAAHRALALLRCAAISLGVLHRETNAAGGSIAREHLAVIDRIAAIGMQILEQGSKA